MNRPPMAPGHRQVAEKLSAKIMPFKIEKGPKGRQAGKEKVLVERPLRTSKWWQQDQNGGCVMTVKVGSKRIEFEKGKAAIAVGSVEKLPAVIDALIKAVRAGELDTQLSEGKGPRMISHRKAT